MIGKKLITISPGGYKGFYMLGICSYIKKYYNLDDYIFSGASAGAWNALFLSYKGEPNDFVGHLLDQQIKQEKSAYKIKEIMKNKLLMSYQNNDFHLNKLLVSVSSLRGMALTPTIYSNFTHLEDAIDCCIASSHIPFITGEFICKYDNVISFDGGCSKFPFLSISKNTPVLQITPNIWKTDIQTNKNKLWFKKITDYTTLLTRDIYDFDDLYLRGYMDAQHHKKELDNVFLSP